MVNTSHEIQELAVVDADTNEVLAGTIQGLLGKSQPSYPDFRQLVMSSSKFDLLRLLWSIDESILVQLESAPRRLQPARPKRLAEQ
jgi:hypothetical protein